jgi:hypothetical protein
VLLGLNRIGASCALIGGLALASHKVARATQDVDLLTEAERADAIDLELSNLGYRCIHRSPDAGNYVRGDERVDLLYASRPIARRLLTSAVERTTPFGPLRVISLEGLIRFKLQGFVNDPRRTQDFEDIRALVKANLDALFVADGGVQVDTINSRDPYVVLDDLMVVVEALCPVWPARPTFSAMRNMRL